MPRFEVIDAITGRTVSLAITAPGPASALSHYLTRTASRYPGTERVAPLHARRPPGSRVRHLTVRELSA